MSLYYPAFINLKGKECVVVGGGRVAERKIAQLIKAGGLVKVISPAITEGLKKQKTKRKIVHIERKYRKGDLKGAFLVVAATSDGKINQAVSQDAESLVNVVDQPALANFIVPSLISRGPLTIAVSTAGASPALARAIREELESSYPADVGQFLRFIKKMREAALKDIPDKVLREAFLKKSASRKTIEQLRSQGFKTVKNGIENSFNSLRRNALA
ncbi:MAG: bifunctional precorrin-2 dehydrogenase/sirohydrochlorin ferrochelatase [Nitrospirae bacterium]|nr:MAG: bifunctional precorrin-2 dehydrogenase/sirohydrochlorin ferrochelatase [Nitrospirota bacterium]